MKKFLVIFMGIFTVLAMSTVVFAYELPEYTYSELIEIYGEPELKDASKFTENKKILVLYEGIYKTYYYYVTTEGFEVYYNNGQYRFRGIGSNYLEMHTLKINDNEPNWNFDRSTQANSINNQISKSEEDYLNNTYYNLTLYSNSDIIITENNSNPDEVGTIFFQKPETQPPAGENPEITQESGELLQVVTQLQETTAEQMKIAEILRTIMIVAVSCLASWTLFLILSKVLRAYLH